MRWSQCYRIKLDTATFHLTEAVRVRIGSDHAWDVGGSIPPDSESNRTRYDTATFQGFDSAKSAIVTP